MKSRSVFAAAALLVVCLPLSATIISGTVTGGTAATAGGTFLKLSLPLLNPFGPLDSVGDDTFQRSNLFGFDEDQNILLTVPLAVDVGSGAIPAGTVVASHYIFFDPGPVESMVGVVNFDSDVLAIITSTDNLALSDFLANTGVDYLSPTLRGLEAEDRDSVTISGPRQIRFATIASTPGDYVRVLTAFSPAAQNPEPAAGILVAAGLFALVAIRRRSIARRS